MKKLLTLLVAAIVVVACNKTKKSDGEAQAAMIQSAKEKESEKVENVTSTVVFNANLATEAELASLGLSEELVAKIIAKRPFISMLALDAMMDPTLKEGVYQYLFVPFNLNTTAEKDFKMIPGVGDRMAHEFEEYRPYTSIKQFKREMAKYVDENEISRYLNYVFVPVELNTTAEDDIESLPGVGKRMTHEFMEYRPYKNLEQFRKEIGKYVDDKELLRLERLVYLKE
jgi:DNA uptake protein ComE-like DNA-binding protein